MPTPVPLFPEMMLRALDVVPPTVLLFEAVLIATPPMLGSAAVPAALVPIKLPWTRLADEPPTILRPTPPLAEMTLPAPAIVPPLVFEEQLLRSTPLNELPNAAFPLASVPMKLPCT